MSKQVPDEKKVIALLNVDASTYELLKQCNFGDVKYVYFTNGIDLFEQYKKKLPIIAITSQSEVMGPHGVHVLKSLNEKNFLNIPFFLIAHQLNSNLIRTAMEYGVTDVFTWPLNKVQIEKRISFSIKNWSNLIDTRPLQKHTGYKISFVKRLFDIIISGTALILLSPLFLLVIILLKLESKGAAFYYSLRVGSGYKVFKFYKFRSMYSNSDKRLKDLKHLNQYGANGKAGGNEPNVTMLCAECSNVGSTCRNQLFTDGNTWCEKQYLFTKKVQADSAFFKLKDDPRITKVGKVLRNTSIDELPQLWNVLKGDMSIVGNRPLPLYEAEKLTTDKYALRFMAPAGITGLWQVEKRGKGEMSEEERLQLDNRYAINHSFTNDIRLILKTIPALFRKENV